MIRVSMAITSPARWLNASPHPTLSRHPDIGGLVHSFAQENTRYVPLSRKIRHVARVREIAAGGTRSWAEGPCPPRRRAEPRDWPG